MMGSSTITVQNTCYVAKQLLLFKAYRQQLNLHFIFTNAIKYFDCKTTPFAPTPLFCHFLLIILPFCAIATWHFCIISSSTSRCYLKRSEVCRFASSKTIIRVSGVSITHHEKECTISQLLFVLYSIGAQMQWISPPLARCRLYFRFLLWIRVCHWGAFSWCAAQFVIQLKNGRILLRGSRIYC